MKIDVLLPVFKSNNILKETLDSIFSQTYNEFRVIIGNDNENKKYNRELYKILEKYKKKIIIINNKKNLGYCKNIYNLFKVSTREIVFLMGDDDIILNRNLFKDYIKIFKEKKNVGVITRCYHWFENKKDVPVRHITPLTDGLNIANLKNANLFQASKLIESLGQLSCLALRKKYLKVMPHKDHVFTSHIYPFINILNKYDFFYYTKKCLAVRIFKSQTRNVSSIYFLSPLKTWVLMIKKSIKDEKVKNFCQDYICRGFIGVLQIKHFSTFANLLREIFYYISYRPKNIFNIFFIILIIYCLLMPKRISLYIVDYFKSVINSAIIKFTRISF